MLDLSAQNDEFLPDFRTVSFFRDFEAGASTRSERQSLQFSDQPLGMLWLFHSQTRQCETNARPV